MDTIINKLSEIEIAASRILDSAATQKKLLDQQQEERIAEYDRQIDQETSDEIEKLRQELSGSMDAELQKLRQSSEDELNTLKSSYQKNHESLAEQIYEKIIRK